MALRLCLERGRRCTRCCPAGCRGGSLGAGARPRRPGRRMQALAAAGTPCRGALPPKLAWPRSAVLFPLVVTVYVTWWFLTFFDNFFSVRLAIASHLTSEQHPSLCACCMHLLQAWFARPFV